MLHTICSLLGVVTFHTQSTVTQRTGWVTPHTGPPGVSFMGTESDGGAGARGGRGAGGWGEDVKWDRGSTGKERKVWREWW